MYHIKDAKGRLIGGRAYGSELQAVSIDDSQHYFLIDRIVRERGTGKGKEYLCSFKGHGKAFDQWIPAKQLKTLPPSRPVQQRPRKKKK